MKTETAVKERHPGACSERNQAVIYKGPFCEVLDDDDGHRLERGVRYAVCDKTWQVYRKAPYAEFVEFVEPLTEVPLENAAAFECERTTRRDSRETKGREYRASTAVSQCCDRGNCC